MAGKSGKSSIANFFGRNAKRKHEEIESASDAAVSVAPVNSHLFSMPCLFNFFLCTATMQLYVIFRCV